MQNCVLTTKNTSHYGSHPSSVVFERKTAKLGTELQVSMCPSPHQWFCAFEIRNLKPELQVSMGP